MIVNENYLMKIIYGHKTRLDLLNYFEIIFNI
jgi:hypothetical protein